MYSCDTQIRVRYGECDQMGYLHHSNYARYYEVARVELMRSLGFPYGEMENSGIIMPVLNMECKFIKPVLYDEMVTVRATISEMPKTRMKLAYEVFNNKAVKVNQGATDLCFVDSKSRRPMRCPDNIADILNSVFNV